MGEAFRRIFADPLTKLASVLVALLAWLYVQSDQVLEARLVAPIDWELPDARMPTVPLPDSAVVTLRGTHAATRRAAEAGARLRVDLTTLPLGEHRVDLAAVPPTGLSSGVEVVGVNPGELRFTMDEATTRKVKIEVAQVGDLAAGFLVDGVDVEPPVVELRGPRSAMSGLRVVRIEPLDVSGLRADASFLVDLDLPIGVSISVGGVIPSATVHVRPAIERVRFAAVPVYVWGHPEWRSSAPKVEILVEGSASELERLRAEDVVGFIHLPESPSASAYEAPWGPEEGVRLRILHPGGEAVKVLKVTPSRVRAVRP